MNENKPKLKTSVLKEGTFNEVLDNLKNDKDVQEAVKGLQAVSVGVATKGPFTEVTITLSKDNPVDMLLKSLFKNAISDIVEKLREIKEKQDGGDND